ncbi:Translation initiation factor SUI1 [seawater metagenome]|uniref:Translation initiation factor SUI1 n=1 Tax=seawater metagenome TaxID=1561972 RepID=A0A5E8CMB0_9ZZZZ
MELINEGNKLKLTDIDCLVILVKAKRLFTIAASYLLFQNASSEEELFLIDELDKKIKIKSQPRSKKKSICIIEGLSFEKEELKGMLKQMKKLFACNGNIVDNEEHGLIIQLQGDVKNKVKKFLMTTYKIKDDKICIFE